MAWTTAPGSLPRAELIARTIIATGMPGYLVERFDHFRRELGIGYLLVHGHESRMDHVATMRSI